ncbi:MAG: HPr family phosphocarrier protein [Rhodospirillales bacterium]|jgi:phosphocarrier protein|nr:HPr family phosphocarrier protein [Rhodospirillales bacterium]
MTNPKRSPGPAGEASIVNPVVIRNERGLHARAASKFVKLVADFEADVTVSKGCQTVSGRSILGLMMLAAGPGSEIVIATRGPEAAEAAAALCGLVEARFEE